MKNAEKPYSSGGPIVFQMTIGMALVTITSVLFAYNTKFTEYPLSFGTHILFACVTTAHCFIFLTRQENSVGDAVVIGFNLLFIIIAPSMQLSAMRGNLINTMVADDSDIALANATCILMMVGYAVGRYNMFSRAPPPKTSDFKWVNKSATLHSSFFWIFVIVLLAAIGGFETLSRISVPLTDGEGISPSEMIVSKFFFFLPAAFALVFASHTFKARLTFSKIAVLSILLICLAAVQNPILEKRNSLGPVYFTLTYVIVRNSIGSPVRLLAFVLIPLIVLLPASSIFTHVAYDNWVDNLYRLGDGIIYEHFVSINYDAWSNVVAVVQMVERDGLYFGKQLLGDVLFFIPREIWPNKPVPTGIEIGEFLINNYAGWFTNLSAPLPSEAYIDFGLLGCLGYGCGLGLFTKRLVYLIDKDDDDVWTVAAIYFSFFLVFVLRGSLLVALAYGLANFAAFGAVRLMHKRTPFKIIPISA